MRAFLLTLIILLLSNVVAAQKMPEWYRVYTFDESFIDMNTASVLLGGDIGRVTFRWTFDQPQVLTNDSPLKYKSRLETMEFKCSDHLYRMYEVSFLNSSGKIIRSQVMSPPYEWHKIYADSVMQTVSGSACELIRARMDPDAKKRSLDEERRSDGVVMFGSLDEERVSDKVVMFARSIKDTLERSRDFKPVIDKFFVADFIKRYLDDDENNWFYNLNRDTALRASNADLKRFYVAMLNAGYLTSLYVISQSPSDEDSDEDELPPEDKMLPADVNQLINSHPYTLAYKSKQGGYDYLAENIDNIARMRSYTDLLERISVLMRKHVTRDQAEHSKMYANMLEDSVLKPRECSSDCLGLPKGTKLFEMTLPSLRIEFAETNGGFKIISATDSSR